MGIQDRDYYRNEGPSILDTLMPTGIVCRWLIGINVVVFILQLVTQGAAAHGGDQPMRIRCPAVAAHSAINAPKEMSIPPDRITADAPRPHSTNRLALMPKSRSVSGRKLRLFPRAAIIITSV